MSTTETQPKEQLKKLVYECEIHLVGGEVIRYESPNLPWLPVSFPMMLPSEAVPGKTVFVSPWSVVKTVITPKPEPRSAARSLQD